MNKCLLPLEYAIHPEGLVCAPTHMDDGNGMPHRASRKVSSALRLRILLRRMAIIISAQRASRRSKMAEKKIL